MNANKGGYGNNFQQQQNNQMGYGGGGYNNNVQTYAPPSNAVTGSYVP